MSMRLGAAVMAVLLAVYLVFAIYYSFVLFGTGEPVAIAIGAAMLVLPALGMWFIGAEVVFGVRAERLAARLERDGGLPEEQVSTSATGRVDRADADALFPTYQAAVEQDPDDWRAWYRLALVYDAAGDRRRARWATRTAIRLERGTLDGTAERAGE